MFNKDDIVKSIEHKWISIVREAKVYDDGQEWAKVTLMGYNHHACSSPYPYQFTTQMVNPGVPYYREYSILQSELKLVCKAEDRIDLKNLKNGGSLETLEILDKGDIVLLYTQSGLVGEIIDYEIFEEVKHFNIKCEVQDELNVPYGLLMQTLPYLILLCRSKDREDKIITFTLRDKNVVPIKDTILIDKIMEE